MGVRPQWIEESTGEKEMDFIFIGDESHRL
jgi:hypothetical protein